MGRLGAMLIAEQLKQRWKRVTLVTSLMFPGEGEGITTSYTLLRALAEAGVAIIDRAKIARIEGDRITLDGVFGEPRGTLEGVEIITSLIGSISETALVAPLRKAGVPNLCDRGRKIAPRGLGRGGRCSDDRVVFGIGEPKRPCCVSRDAGTSSPDSRICRK